MRAWVERFPDAVATAERTDAAMRQVFALHWCSVGLHFQGIVSDLYERLYPCNPDYITCSPVSEKQAGMIAGFAHRFRKQIANLAPWQRREFPG